MRENSRSQEPGEKRNDLVSPPSISLPNPDKPEPKRINV
jgi:hypothetical protein